RRSGPRRARTGNLGGHRNDYWLLPTPVSIGRRSDVGLRGKPARRGRKSLGQSLSGVNRPLRFFRASGGNLQTSRGGRRGSRESPDRRHTATGKRHRNPRYSERSREAGFDVFYFVL